MVNIKKLNIVDRKDYETKEEYQLAYTKKYNQIYFNNKKRHCEICNLDFQYFYYPLHLKSKKHIKKIYEIKNNELLVNTQSTQTDFEN